MGHSYWSDVKPLLHREYSQTPPQPKHTQAVVASTIILYRACYNLSALFASLIATVQLYLHITSVLPSILPSQPKHPPCFSKTRPLNFQSSASAAASQPHIAMFVLLGLLGLLATVLIYSTLKCGTLHDLSSVHNTLQLCNSATYRILVVFLFFSFPFFFLSLLVLFRSSNRLSRYFILDQFVRYRRR
jgi:hypothetical protein